MLTLNDIINVSFRKSRLSGYNTEDVDNFIDQVKESYDELMKKNIELKEEMEKRGSFRDVVITETAGVATVYANDGGIVIAL